MFVERNGEGELAVARPRKVNTDDMLKIIDECYEEHGNAACLKCSFLAGYAAVRGMEVQAYDFRRNPAARARIDELRDLMPFSSGTEPMAYKNLDVDAFIMRARNKESLKSALLELDSSWRRIYERACALLKEKESLASSLKQQRAEHELLKREHDGLSALMQQMKTDIRSATAKNRYLANAVREYLYPAVANEILVGEGSLIRTDTQVTSEAMASLVDGDVPASLPKASENDRRILSREEILINRMASGVGGLDET